MEQAVVMVLVFIVDLLLLFTAEQMCRGKRKTGRYLIGAFLGSCFAAASLLPEAVFLRRWAGYILSVLLIALSVYGFGRKSLPKVLLFLLLHLSLGRVTSADNNLLSILLGAIGIWLACWLLKSNNQLVPVELKYREKHLHIHALRDTGNTLLDPITGQGVLIVSKEVAKELTGLTVQQLQDPLQTIGTIPGLRLIPYRTVGNTGFLLAMQLREVWIGNRKESVLVAFSPQQLGTNYEALTGGMK